jgi:transposase-like protein
MAEHLQRAEPDLLRSMLLTFVQALMSAEADAICGAPYGERSAERVNSRNGYRIRDFDTRTGTMEVAIPKLREGSYFPDWLLERRRRAERALTTVVATCYLLGVSTGGWRSWSRPSASPGSRSRRSRRWHGSSTPTWSSSGPDHLTRGPTRSWPPTR